MLEGACLDVITTVYSVASCSLGGCKDVVNKYGDWSETVFDVTLLLVVVHWLDVEPRDSPIGYYVISVRDWSRVVFGKGYLSV